MGFAQQVDTYTSSDTWTCPAGITSVQVECYAGGCGGYWNGGTGGGGGAYSIDTDITVVPATGYTVTVGAAGVQNGASPPTAGGDSWFGTTGTIFAEGGGQTTLAVGGAAANGVGETKYSGGTSDGSNRGGGGGAGSTGDGGDPSGNTGGSAGGGLAGSGGNATSGTGGNGSAAGGAGAGGTSFGNGGNGARGVVVITYQVRNGPPATVETVDTVGVIPSA